MAIKIFIKGIFRSTLHFYRSSTSDFSYSLIGTLIDNKYTLTFIIIGDK